MPSLPKPTRRAPARWRPAAPAFLACACALAAAAPADAPAASLEEARATALLARLRGEVDQPQAVADLLRLDELRDDLTDLGPVAAGLDQIIAALKARSDVRALARFVRAQLSLSLGQLPQARAAAGALAQVRTWAVIGPFDNDGRSGLAAEYPPEKEGFVPGAHYPGKEHEVAWRTLPDPGPLGLVNLASAIAPHVEVAVYAATVLPVGRAQGAVLHLGASGAVKLWLNGALVHEDKNQHPAQFDQTAIPVRLRAGDNTLLLKIAHGTGRLGFGLRVAGEKDEPLPAVAAGARAPTVAQADPQRTLVAAPHEQPGRQPPLPRFFDALQDLRERAARLPADARAQEDLAIVLAARRPDDETERLAVHAQERASAAAPGDAQIELRLARLEDQDSNKRRAALERAVEKNPLDPEALGALARFRLDRGDGWKALELAVRAEQAAPARLQTRLLKARALEAVGLGSQGALARLRATEGLAGDVRALRARASALRRLGRTDEAMQVLAAGLALRFDEADLRGELTGLRLDRGDLDGALALISDALLLEPSQLSLRLRAAELLSQNGRTSDADQAYALALSLSPDDADLHEALGRHRLREGDTAEDTKGALAAFGRALELRPQNPSLRELVRTVKPEERYAAAYLADAAALSKAPSLAGADDDSEVLADVQVVKVFPNGLSSRTHQLVIRALNARGVEQSRAQSVQFSPDRQLVRVERARLFRRDGAVLESRSEGERSLSEPWYGLYYDLRAKVISFPQLQAGDVLEVVTRVDDAGQNYFADYFGDFAYLQGTAVKQRTSYVLLGPPGRTFYAEASALPGLKRTEEGLADGGSLLRFDAERVPRILLEPSTPGWSNLAAWVHVSTYRDWEGVGRFYWGLVKDQLRVTEEVRKAALEAAAGVTAPEGPERERALIRAVYGYVLSKTRYVALEFGINSFKPYPVETILSRRFGDCKDKASLMHALLEALGIDSRLVLLRMKRMGTLQREPASLAIFNHAILYVPKYDLYLDGTAEFHGSEELPGDDHGAEVLIVEPGGAGSRYLRTPEARAESNTDTIASEVELAADGSALLRQTTRSRGSHTPELRRTFESADERRARAEELLARGAYPGVKVNEVEVSDPHAIEQAFELRVRARAPGFAAKVAGGGLRFPPFGQRQALVELMAPLSRRSLPERLPEAGRTRLEAQVRLPAGFKALLPEDAAGQAPQGRWSVRYSQEAGVVKASFDLQLEGGLLQPEGYAAFRDFLGKLDQAIGRPVTATPGASAALDPAGAAR